MGKSFPVVLMSYWRSLFGLKRAPLLYPQGRYHHLEDILRRVNTEYFEGRLDLKITWFTPRRSAAPRKIVLGSYHSRLQTIRISSHLDGEHIPDYFVAYIVYHEALHYVLPPIKGKRGKRSIHHLQFKTEEKKFKQYDLAKAFSSEIRKKLFGKTPAV